MYVPKSEFGWNRRTGWLHGDEASYNNMVDFINVTALKPGRQRSRPIHESWLPILNLFDSSNPQRSQGAFCRWAGINRSSFSAAQCKPLGDDTERFILEWDAKGKEVENG